MPNREPVGNTCPTIDSAIAELEQIAEFANDIQSRVTDTISIMEELRHANSSLRDWGNEEADRVDELEDEVIDLTSKIEDLEHKVESLEVDYLEKDD